MATNFKDKGGIIIENGLQIGSKPTYTIDNDSTDRAIDANATSDAELADVLCTLIKDLEAMGLITTTTS